MSRYIQHNYENDMFRIYTEQLFEIKKNNKKTKTKTITKQQQHVIGDEIINFIKIEWLFGYFVLLYFCIVCVSWCRELGIREINEEYDHNDNENMLVDKTKLN